LTCFAESYTTHHINKADSHQAQIHNFFMVNDSSN